MKIGDCRNLDEVIVSGKRIVLGPYIKEFPDVVQCFGSDLEKVDGVWMLDLDVEVDEFISHNRWPEGEEVLQYGNGYIPVTSKQDGIPTFFEQRSKSSNITE